MEQLLFKSLTTYTLTFIFASSSLFYKFREFIKTKTPYLKLSPNHPHFIECRMCIGFWVSLVVCNLDYNLILPTYALSYFLATQER